MLHFICFMGENKPCHFLRTFQGKNNNAFSNLHCLETQSQGITQGRLYLKQTPGTSSELQRRSRENGLLKQLVWIKQTSLLSELNSLKIQNEPDPPWRFKYTHSHIWTYTQPYPYEPCPQAQWVMSAHHGNISHMVSCKYSASLLWSCVGLNVVLN